MARHLMTQRQLALIAMLTPKPVADSFRSPDTLESATVAAAARGYHAAASSLATDGLVDQGQFHAMIADARTRATQLFNDHRARALSWFRLMSIAASVGLVTILTGAVVSICGAAVNGGLAAIAGVIVEAIGLLFFRNWAAVRKDLREYEASLAVIESADLSVRMIGLIADQVKRDALIVDLIATLTRMSARPESPRVQEASADWNSTSSRQHLNLF